MSDQPSAAEQLKQLYGRTEKSAAKATEELVRSEGFGELLARVTENVMALTRIGFDSIDLVVRNLRLAGRPDLIRLGRQIGRTEDKLERVLQEIERLQDQVAALERSSSKAGRANASSSSRRRSSSSGSKRSRSSSNGRSGSRSSRSSS